MGRDGGARDFDDPLTTTATCADVEARSGHQTGACMRLASQATRAHAAHAYNDRVMVRGVIVA